jgi:3-methyladenine DNA glycosylase AlkC
LATLFDDQAVALIAESFADVQPGFAVGAFRAQALQGLDGLALMPRAQHIANALGAHLPDDPGSLANVVIASLGPPLPSTAGMGLAPFFYLPHVRLIGDRLSSDLDAGLRANRAVTSRFSAEFSIRPLILRHQAEVLSVLARWARDPDPHVRRLVSEGTRPRLPWAGRLAPFQRDPAPTLALLELLKDDPELYVRRSVANHLGDIAKDHPQVAYATAQRWIDEAALLEDPAAGHRYWIVRHALRLPAKQGAAAAIRLRHAAGG